MGIKKYILKEGTLPSEEQMQKAREAAARPIAFDDDNPELTEEQLAQFRRVHQSQQNDRRRQNVTLRLKPQTIRQAHALGKGYSGILSRIIEETLNNPEELKKFL